MAIRFLKKSSVADFRDPRVPIVHANQGEVVTTLDHEIEERMIRAGRAERVKESKHPLRRGRHESKGGGESERATAGEGAGESSGQSSSGQSGEGAEQAGPSA